MNRGRCGLLILFALLMTITSVLQASAIDEMAESGRTPTESPMERLADMPVSFSDVLSLPQETPDVVSRYGDAPQQFGELWVPDTGGPLPVVVLIHGGCWQNGFGIDHARPMASALRAADYLVWAIEYRRIGDPGGGWPGTFTDVAAAIDHLSVVLEQTGVESAEVILMGHSAGGQLALWASGRSGFEENHAFHFSDALKPEGVVGLAAITDMETYGAGESSCERSVSELMGPPDRYPSRYAAVSPISNIPTGICTALVQGVEDPIVPLAQADRFEQAAREGGNKVTVHRIDGAGHFDLIHPDTEAWTDVLGALETCR